MHKNPGNFHLLNCVRINQFATIRGVSRRVVFYHIKRGLIIPEFVGREKVPFIDLEKYKDYTFRDLATRTTKPKRVRLKKIS